MRRGALVAALLLPLAAARALAARATKDQLRLVEGFVDTPIADLPPDRVDEFMAVDAASLPAKLRLRYEARRVELQTLKQLTENKKKGTVRTPETSCKIDDSAKSDDPRVLEKAGFVEITDDEEHCVIERTQCTEHDMLCEFSLQITVERQPKTHKVVGRRLFLSRFDPLMGIVGACQAKNGAGGSTPFFGQGGPVCSH